MQPRALRMGRKFGIKMRLNMDDGLFLETIQAKDAAALFQLIDVNRNYLREWMPWEKNQLSIADTHVFIQQSEKEFKTTGVFQAGVFSDGNLCGMIGVHALNSTNKNICMGYWLGEAFQGRGLMTKAAGRLVQYCFHELQLHRIEIRCGTENKKSQAVAERLGFAREGTLRETEWLNGKFIDHFLYALLSPKPF